MHHILCVNSGSSSLKFHLFEMGQTETVLAAGAVEDIGQDDGRVWFVDGQKIPFAERAIGVVDQEGAIEQALSALSEKSLPPVEAIGHRIVHGGPGHLSPEILTDDLMDDLRRHVAWAPLHLPGSLRVIEAISAHHPGLPQVACFDTAFHAGMPEIARRLALPRQFYDEGIRKYGFHGLSYEFVCAELGPAVKGRMIIAHLGNGASMVACVDGRSIDTTMGMTPLGGFMMGTRAGDLDPGVPLYLVRERGYDDKALEQLLDKSSGLKGVSGETADMQTLLEISATNKAAAQAVEMFCYQAAKTVGALTAALGGLDLLVFTGGMGEKAAAVRSMICGRLGHLGVQLNEPANQANAPVISSDGGACPVRIVRTNEDLVIARHTRDLVFGAAG